MLPRCVNLIWPAWRTLVRYASFEVVLDWTGQGNGGDVILFRSAGITLLGWALISPFCDSYDFLRSAALFGATYAALYTRFSSQWTYLAGVYNQIKAAQARMDPTNEEARRAIAEWKAAFIQDSDALHLATKRLFAETVRAWGSEREVENLLNQEPGKEAWQELKGRVEQAIESHRSERRGPTESVSADPVQAT